MGIKREALQGTKQVFRFSLQQYFKSKSTYVMLIVLFFGTGLSMLLSGIGMTRGEEAGTDARKVYLHNESTYILETRDFLPDYTETEYTAETLEVLLDRLDDGAEHSVVLDIRLDAESGACIVTAYTGKNSRVGNSEAVSLSACCASAVEAARYRALGVSEEQITIALGGVSAEVKKETEWNKPEDGSNLQNRYLVGFACSLIVFMLVSLSTNYIVKAIAEEKSTRLVEVLMISVRPLALVTGKILAALCLVLVNAAAAVLGFLLCGQALRLLGYSDTAVSGFQSALSSLTAGGILSLLVSLVLGYLCFAIMAGISGACCSTATDTDSASTSVMMLAIMGYMTGTGTGMVKDCLIMRLLSVLPFFSPFIAPARYMNGQLPFAFLLLSWLLQTAALLILSRSCAGIYATLIFHQGERVTAKQVLKLIRGERTV